MDFVFPAPFVCTGTCNAYSFLEGFPSSEMQTVKRWEQNVCISVLIATAKQEDFRVASGDAFAGHSVWEKVSGFSKDDCDEI